MAYKGPKLSALHGDALKRRISSLVASGNTAAIPTKYLTGANAKYARERAKNLTLDQPVVPGSTLSNRDLAHEAATAGQVQYGGVERDQAQQARNLTLQRSNTADYYDTYLKALGAANAQAGANAAATATALQNIGASGQKAGGDQDAAVLARMQADAQSRGANVSPGFAAEAQQAGQVGRTLSDAQAGTATLLGQAQQGYLGLLQGSAGQGKLQALSRNALASQRLGEQQADVAREKGASNLSYRTKRRSEEQTNVATSALAGVNAAAKAAGVEQGAARVKIQQKNADTAAERAASAGKPSSVAKPPSNYTGSPADWNALSRAQRDAYVKAHPTKTSKGKTPKTAKGPKPAVGLGSITPQQENDKAQQINTIAGWLQNPPKDDNGKTQTAAQILEKLRTGKNPLGKPISPQILNAAKSLASNRGKGLGPFGIHNAHLEGVHVKGRWNQLPKAKRKPPAGPAGPLA